MPLEARYSSRPLGERVLKNMMTLVDMERRDFSTTEKPLPSKWNDVSSVRGLMDEKHDGASVTVSRSDHQNTPEHQRKQSRSSGGY